MTERDPNGLPQHALGAKLDADKLLASMVLADFAPALREVIKVGTYGADRYTPRGWLYVVDGEQRYANARMRHWLDRAEGFELDEDSELLHLAHEAWNVLAELTLCLRRIDSANNWQHFTSQFAAPQSASQSASREGKGEDSAQGPALAETDTPSPAPAPATAALTAGATPSPALTETGSLPTHPPPPDLNSLDDYARWWHKSRKCTYGSVDDPAYPLYTCEDQAATPQHWSPAFGDTSTPQRRLYDRPPYGDTSPAPVSWKRLPPRVQDELTKYWEAAHRSHPAEWEDPPITRLRPEGRSPLRDVVNSSWDDPRHSWRDDELVAGDQVHPKQPTQAEQDNYSNELHRASAAYQRGREDERRKVEAYGKVTVPFNLSPTEAGRILREYSDAKTTILSGAQSNVNATEGN